ncbi:MAG: PDZ domain-containing protein, partial [bacterium]
WLGATTNDVGEKTIVNRVVAGSPAYEAGLDPDDEIVALDGYKVRTRDLISRISDLKEGTRVRLTVFRDDRLREFDVVLRTNENVPMKVTKVEKPSALQKAIYSSWLASSTESKEKK